MYQPLDECGLNGGFRGGLDAKGVSLAYIYSDNRQITATLPRTRRDASRRTRRHSWVRRSTATRQYQER
jgi:hypothetical protein